MKQLPRSLAAWVGLLSAGTALAAAWAVLLGLLWGVLVADINPDDMPPLTEHQQAVVVRVTRTALVAAAAPPVVLSVAWAATTTVLLSRRRAAPDAGKPVAPADATGATS